MGDFLIVSLAEELQAYEDLGGALHGDSLHRTP